MKKAVVISLFIVFNSMTSLTHAQQDVFIKDYLERWENSRKYLIKIAEMMPEENYDFKATSESLSFAENFMHVGFAIDWHTQSILGGRGTRDYKTDTIYKVHNKSKKEMIATLNKTFDEATLLIKNFDVKQFDDELDYFGLKRTKRQIFLLLADHVTHHRGQMLVYLRLNGIVPPRYVLFQ